MPKKKEQTADTEVKPKGKVSKPRAPKLATVTEITPPADATEPTPLGILAEETLLQYEFTPDAIAVRAYFLAEKRRSEGLHPDPVHDWLEAERQILSEIEASSTPVKKSRAKKTK